MRVEILKVQFLCTLGELLTYNCLILAEYYKQKYQNKQSLYTRYINRGYIQDLQSQTPWDTDHYFQAYLTSAKEGEYKLTQQEYDPYQMAMVKKYYFYGGILLYPSVIARREAPKQSQSSPSRLSGNIIKAKWITEPQAKPGEGEIELRRQYASSTWIPVPPSKPSVMSAMRAADEDNLSAESGGTMGRWNYERAAFAPQTEPSLVGEPIRPRKLILHNATRIPKDGVVEEEFLIEGENKPRDIALYTRGLRAREELKIRGLQKELGVSKYPWVIVREESAIFHRIYGVAVEDIVFIREDIISKGTRNQIKEALDHERRELAGAQHNQIRQRQYQGDLRSLITELSKEDKASLTHRINLEGTILTPEKQIKLKPYIFNNQTESDRYYQTIPDSWRIGSSPFDETRDLDDQYYYRGMRLTPKTLRLISKYGLARHSYWSSVLNEAVKHSFHPSLSAIPYSDFLNVVFRLPKGRGIRPEGGIIFEIVPSDILEILVFNKEKGRYDNITDSIGDLLYPQARAQRPAQSTPNVNLAGGEARPPQGAPATLLRYMRDKGIFSANPQKSIDMADKRGGNDSQRTIQIELRVLQDTGLVQGGRDGYYLADWLQVVDLEEFIRDNQELEKASPSDEEIQTVIGRVKKQLAKIIANLKVLKHELNNTLAVINRTLDFYEESNCLTPQLAELRNFLKQISEVLDGLSDLEQEPGIKDAYLARLEAVTKGGHSDVDASQLAKIYSDALVEVSDLAHILDVLNIFLARLRAITEESHSYLEASKIADIFNGAYRQLPKSIQTAKNKRERVNTSIEQLFHVKDTLSDFFPSSESPSQLVNAEASALYEKMKPGMDEVETLIGRLSSETTLSEPMESLLENIGGRCGGELLEISNDIIRQHFFKSEEAELDKNHKVIFRVLSDTLSSITGKLMSIAYHARDSIDNFELTDETIRTMKDNLPSVRKVLIGLQSVSEVRLNATLNGIFIPGKDDIRHFPKIMRSFTTEISDAGDDTPPSPQSGGGLNYIQREDAVRRLLAEDPKLRGKSAEELCAYLEERHSGILEVFRTKEEKVTEVRTILAEILAEEVQPKAPSGIDFRDIELKGLNP